ncbi:MAG: NADH-quinone oxidoreductase subunit C [Myxococcota bacterium]
MSQAALDRLKQSFGAAVVESHNQHGDETATVQAEELVELMSFLRDDELTRFEMLSDLTGVDYLGKREPRFEVVYHLYSLSLNHRLRVKVQVEEEAPALPSVMQVWRSAYWMEREAYDLYGIKFEGHPDLRRVLLYEQFEGHPLRKDYDMEKRQPLIPPREGKQHL